MDKHIESTTHVNDLFKKLHDIAADPNPEARDADPVSAESIAIAGDLLNRFAHASTCRTMSREAVAHAELYPSRDGGILIIIPLNSNEFEFMIAPDGEIDLSITRPGQPGDVNRIVEMGQIHSDNAVREIVSFAKA